MITLNPFVENNKARINQFLNNLCEVGDFYDTLEVQMLFSALVLVTVEREHNRLQERVDLSQADEATQGRDMPRLRLEQEEEVRVLL